MKTWKWLILLILITCSFLAFLSAPVMAENGKEALIIYEESSPKDRYSIEGTHVANLLGHFGITGRQVPASQYRKGEMAGAPAVFYIGSQKSYSIGGGLLEELGEYRGRLFWIGNHLDQLLKSPNKRLSGITCKGAVEGVDFVTYRGSRLTKGAAVINEIVTDGTVEIIAWAQKNGKKIPYMVRKGSFWYLADVPFTFYDEDQRYLVFCDALHDFLGIEHQERHRTIVRIEDVNPTSSPETIRQIADMLSSMKVPFIIALVPEYIGTYSPTPLSLSSRPQLVEALQYAVSKGGTISLHGYTHQYTGDSTIDYEFWDGKTNGPLKEDTPLYLEDRLEKALDECFKCRIYPLLWTTPHYVASTDDYRSLARHCSTVCERRIYFDQYYSRQSFPYIIEKDVYGQRIIPEYLGFVPYIAGDGGQKIEEEKKAALNLVATARTMKCVRDGVVGFFFHPFIDISVLREMVTAMKAAGYEFMDVRQFNNRIAFKDKVIATGDDTVSISLNREFLREFYIDGMGGLRKESISQTRLSRTVERRIKAPGDWIYVAEGMDEGKEIAAVGILWNKEAQGREMRDQEAFLATVQSLGISAKKISSIDGLRDENVLIIPFGSAGMLKEADRSHVTRFVEEGGILLTDGVTRLTASLGFKSDSKPVVKGVKDLYYNLDFFTSGFMETVVPEAGDKLIYQAQNGPALGVIRKVKRGGIFYLSTPYDPDSGRGYSRFPTLINVLLSFFNLHPPEFVPRLEAYFEPGLRQDVSTEVLAKSWREIGIRYIHVSAWHFYQNWSYDYKLLINECHKRGIAVYAWLELPYLTREFWDRHPEFREKNYMGGDVQNFWRYPLALEDPACREAVYVELEKVFANYDFDGVNMAELYFENEGEEMSNTKTLSPFHPWALKAFQDKYGFDMRDIFNPESSHYYRKNEPSVEKFYQFRADLIYSLHAEFIKFLEKIRKSRKNFDIVITVVDSLEYPKAVKNWGVDARRIASLMKDYPFTLMVEDPYTMWDLSPERYERIKKAYRNIGVPPSKLALNLNVVDIHEQGSGFASSRQTGTELYQMLRAASSEGHRVISYCEATIPDQDLPLIGSVMEAPKGAILPSQESTGAMNVRWASGTIYGLRETGDGIALQYDSPTTCYVALSCEPQEVWIDGAKAEKSVLTGEGEWIICLPSGKHDARVSGNR